MGSIIFLMTKRYIDTALALKTKYVKIQLLMHDIVDDHSNNPESILNCNVGKNPYNMTYKLNVTCAASYE